MKPFVVETRVAKTKTCDVCGRDLPRSEFRSNGGSQVRPTCRVCECANRKDYVRNEETVGMVAPVFQTVEERAMRLIQSGYTDSAASWTIGCSEETIREYRRKMGPKYKIIPPSVPVIHRSGRFSQPKSMLVKSEAEPRANATLTSDPKPAKTRSQALKPVITGADAPAIVESPDTPHNPRIFVSDIQRAVAEHFGVTVHHIKRPDMDRRTMTARHLAMYLSRELTLASFPEMGRLFSRDHSSVLSAVKRVEKLVASGDARTLEAISSISRKLGVSPPRSCSGAPL